MDIPWETDEYIKESIQNSLGLSVSDKTLEMKLLISEDERRRLQDKIFVLQDRLADAERRLELHKAESSLNAQGLKRCIEDKESISSKYAELANRCSTLETECGLYERDVERLMDSCDELGRENEELKRHLQENSVDALISENETLKTDMDYLRTNLNRAEEEANVLFKENSDLREEIKKLMKLLNGEKSAGFSGKGKRKSSSLERGNEFEGGVDLSRLPLSPLQQNSPNGRMHKK